MVIRCEGCTVVNAESREVVLYWGLKDFEGSVLKGSTRPLGKGQRACKSKNKAGKGAVQGH
jgi:hypothetical protein